MNAKEAMEISKGFVLNKDTLLIDMEQHFHAKGFLEGCEFKKKEMLCHFAPVVGAAEKLLEALSLVQKLNLGKEVDELEYALGSQCRYLLREKK